MPRKNPRRNISRIEQYSRSGTEHSGWEVRIQRRGKRIEKFFADNAHRGKRAALQAAKAFRDSMEQELKPYTVKELAKSPSIRNKSGIVGVRRSVHTDIRGNYEFMYAFWVAQWTDGKGRRRTRSFSVDRHGEEQAFRMALQARQNGVNQAGRTL